jgi:hypothetical protein
MSLDAVLERIGVTLTPVSSSTEIHSPKSYPPRSSNSTHTGLSSPTQSTPTRSVKRIKKLSKLNKSFGASASPSNGDSSSTSIRVHPREVLSRGAGFRSPNHFSSRGSPPLDQREVRPHLSAYIRSPTDELAEDSNLNEFPDEEALRRYTTPPVPHNPAAIDDSLSLSSQAYPMRGGGGLRVQKPPLHSRGSSSKWLSLPPQDVIPAPVPRLPPPSDKRKKERQRSAPSSSASSRRPISTTNYGDGLYAISSYKNVLDQDYLDHHL